MNKFLVMLLTLVSIVTVSCKKNIPTEPAPAPKLEYKITAEIRGSIPINYYGSLFIHGEQYPLTGTTPDDYTGFTIFVLTESIGVAVAKSQATGTLSVALRD